ncbi:MAG: N-acyl homoserine lactonase family protein [Sphaerochaeta sp.]|uniref:N-acyl homoserine lactonase family protein n=1 Tax=Sphaerochaeta sp. TaxID=1972642 RepID=UPI003D0EC3CE
MKQVCTGFFGPVGENVLFEDGDINVTHFVPSMLYLIRDGEEDYVVDTGFSDTQAQTRIYGLAFHRQDSYLDVLERVGIEPGKVKHLILTHLHWDHMANLALFPNARIYCQSVEYWRVLAEQDDVAETIRRAESRVMLVTEEYRLSPSIFLKRASGHTAGCQAVYVMDGEKRVCIAGDNVMCRENLESGRAVGLCQDLPGARAFLEEMRRMEEQGDFECICSHDYRQFKHGGER